MKNFLALVLVFTAFTSDAKVQNLARDPYVGAIAIDADSGDVLFADNADAQGYPASVLKLMDLLLILEMVEQGQLRYTDEVRTTAEACGLGGSQVWLKEHEVFSIEELLYALMIQSANDAAAALAIHIAGTQQGFVSMMNEKAKALGMTQTRFSSVHGLPPRGDEREPDVTTARDLATLCRELAKRADAYKFTSVQQRIFRPAGPPIDMRTHNHLLGSVEGCDGFKTGFFRAAGYSTAVTAKRGDNRVICVILSSAPPRENRDNKARELIAKGFLVMPAKKTTPPPASALPPPSPLPAAPEMEPRGGGVMRPMMFGLLIGLGIAGIVWFIVRSRKSAKGDFIRRS